MKRKKIPGDLSRVARRMVWYDPPEQSLQDEANFLAHVMTLGTTGDIVTAEKYFSRADFVAALKNAPAGVFDLRSWVYWNTALGRVPVPPMPKRNLI